MITPQLGDKVTFQPPKFEIGQKAIFKDHDGNKFSDIVGKRSHIDDAWWYYPSGKGKAGRFHESQVSSLKGGSKPQSSAQPTTGQQLPLEPNAEKPENLTDLGNALRLVAKHGNDLRYCYDWGKWLIWNGHKWAKDNNGEIVRRAKETIASIYAEASKIEDESERKAIAKHAMKSESCARIKAMIELAQSELPVSSDELDSDPWLLNCTNGTLDLRMGKLRPHNRADMLTKCVPVAYDPSAICPIWHKFLVEILNENDNLYRFIQCAIGYSLTGDVSEQVFFLLHGTGDNGKSVLLETILTMLGDYAKSAPAETIMVKSGGIRNDIARLAGVRLVTMNEVEDGQKLAESLVKELTGKDTVPARFLYTETFDFMPQFKLFIRANHKPVIRGTDDAIWRRIRLIPFTVKIPEKEKDKHLTEKLKDELPGILAWAVRGCLDWQENGLGLPEEVKSAVKEYRHESDIIQQFIDECCITEADDSVKLKTQAKTLHDAYVIWCKANGFDYVTSTSFGKVLPEKGFTKKKSGVYYYEGIGLLKN